MEELGIYIHIPFCKQKCFYCDFCSFANKNEMQEKYVETVINEIKNITHKEKYTVTYTAQVDQTIEASSLEEAKEIAKNGTGEYENQAFESIYLSEVAFITDKDGNEV